MNKNKFLNILIPVSFFSLLAMIVYAGPSAVPAGGNISAPINQLNVSQVKSGSLSVDKFVIGDLAGTGFDVFTSTGELGVNMGLSSNNQVLNPTEELDVNGAIRLSQLTNPGKTICANQNGELEQCAISNNQYTIYQHSGDDTHEYETFSVHATTSIELFGAGGAGRDAGGYNNQQNYSPYDLNGIPSCVNTDPHNGHTYGYICNGGGSAILMDWYGSTTIAEAFGGSAPTGNHTGGNGGSTYIDSSIISGSNSITGQNGGGGEMGVGNNSTLFGCAFSNNNYTMYQVTVGGDGGAGGYGGRSGHGSMTPGGGGGKGGPNLLDLTESERCIGEEVEDDGIGYVSDGGVDGFFGGGGSGAGGIGGESTRSIDYMSSNDMGCYNNPCADSTQGYAGGGGGGYVKILVPPGTYTIKLYHGGVPQLIADNYGCSGANHCRTWSGFRSYLAGTYSGRGSPAMAIVK